MPAGKFTLPNKPSFLPSISELLGAQLPEYEPGYTGRGTLGLEEPSINEMDLALMLLPLLKGTKIPLNALLNQRGGIGTKSSLMFPRSTEEAHSIGKNLTKDQVKSLWGTYKARTAAKPPIDLEEYGKQAYENQLLRETVEGYLGFTKRKSLTPEQIDLKLSDILKSTLKSERGSLSTKKLTEAHHTLPIGGARNLDALDWHLRNLAEGWKTIKDIPKEAHKEITKKQMKDLTKQSISPEEREGILSSLITSPERAELLSDYRRYLLEQVLASQPKGTKAYAFGSAVSKKPNPKDLDVLLEYPTGRDWWNISQHPEKLPVIPKVDLVPSPPLERVPSNVKKMKEIGKKKYGEDYDFLRILSILGLLPLSSLVEKEE